MIKVSKEHHSNAIVKFYVDAINGNKAMVTQTLEYLCRIIWFIQRLICRK